MSEKEVKGLLESYLLTQDKIKLKTNNPHEEKSLCGCVTEINETNKSFVLVDEIEGEKMIYFNEVVPDSISLNSFKP